MCAWCRGSSSRPAGRGRRLSVPDSRVVRNTGTGDLRNLGEERAEGKKQVLEQRKRSSVRFQRERDFGGSHGGRVTEQETANSMQIEFGKYGVLFRKRVLRRFVKVGGEKGIDTETDRQRDWGGGAVAAICLFRRTAGKERQKGKRAEISLPHRKGEIGSRQFVSQRDRVLDREGQHNHAK